MIGVPVNKITLQFSALNKNSYNNNDNDWGNKASGPRFFSANFDILFILFTILLIKLCASSIITTALSNILFSKLFVKSLNLSLLKPLWFIKVYLFLSFHLIDHSTFFIWRW